MSNSVGALGGKDFALQAGGEFSASLKPSGKDGTGPVFDIGQFAKPIGGDGVNALAEGMFSRSATNFPLPTQSLVTVPSPDRQGPQPLLSSFDFSSIGASVAPEVETSRGLVSTQGVIGGPPITALQGPPTSGDTMVMLSGPIPEIEMHLSPVDGRPDASTFLVSKDMSGVSRTPVADAIQEKALELGLGGNQFNYKAGAGFFKSADQEIPAKIDGLGPSFRGDPAVGVALGQATGALTRASDAIQSAISGGQAGDPGALNRVRDALAGVSDALDLIGRTLGRIGGGAGLEGGQPSRGLPRLPQDLRRSIPNPIQEGGRTLPGRLEVAPRSPLVVTGQPKPTTGQIPDVRTTPNRMPDTTVQLGTKPGALTRPGPLAGKGADLISRLLPSNPDRGSVVGGGLTNGTVPSSRGPSTPSLKADLQGQSFFNSRSATQNNAGVRVITPGSAVTADFVPGRINVDVNAEGGVSRIQIEGGPKL